MFYKSRNAQVTLYMIFYKDRNIWWSHYKSRDAYFTQKSWRRVWIWLWSTKKTCFSLNFASGQRFCMITIYKKKFRSLQKTVFFEYQRNAVKHIWKDTHEWTIRITLSWMKFLIHDIKLKWQKTRLRCVFSRIIQKESWVIYKISHKLV